MTNSYTFIRHIPVVIVMSGMGSPCVRYVVEKDIKKALKRMIEKEEVLAIQGLRAADIAQ